MRFPVIRIIAVIYGRLVELIACYYDIENPDYSDKYGVFAPIDTTTESYYTLTIHERYHLHILGFITSIKSILYVHYFRII